MTDTQALVLAIVALGLAALLTPGGRRGFAFGGSLFRRLWWRTTTPGAWTTVARAAGLSQKVTVGETVRWHDPRLLSVRTSRHAVRLKIRTRPGQALSEMEDAADRISTSFGGDSYRCYPAKRRPGNTVMLELTKVDLLKAGRVATMPEPRMLTDAVPCGRRQNGKPFQLQIRERQTLVVGCSGSGKGSLLWSICCGLAPAVAMDAVRLHGIDLKGFLELGMGAPLFTETAKNEEAAVEVLERMDEIAKERMAVMEGKSRSFQPTIGDPLHVLVIDELASLTAYGPADMRKAATPLLGSILTKGRAVGVLVVAFCQDPRKEAIPARGLFTQTIALRLRSSDEVAMTFGDHGIAQLAPAHRISPAAQGTGWVVLDDGSVDRFRADFWSDDMIRAVAARYQPSSGLKHVGQGAEIATADVEAVA